MYYRQQHYKPNYQIMKCCGFSKMNNLFKRSPGTRHRGLPDNYPHHTPIQTQLSAVTSPSPSSLPTALAPPNAYPYQASSQPALPGLKLNTGNNTNKNGEQISGGIKIRNGIPSSEADINTGNNYNEGVSQENDGICIGDKLSNCTDSGTGQK